MDTFSKAERSKLMSKVRSTGNASTELKLLRLFKENSIVGWRRNYKITGRPDFTFPKQKVAIFVDGCFWHGCPYCGRIPKTKKAFWKAKIETNIKRDVRVTRILRNDDWSVIRIKECRLKKCPLLQVKRVKRILNSSS